MKRPLAAFCGAFIAASFVVSVFCLYKNFRQTEVFCLSVLVALVLSAIFFGRHRKTIVVMGIGVFAAFAVFCLGFTVMQDGALSLAGEEHTYYARVTDADEISVISVDGKRVVPFHMELRDTKLPHAGKYLSFTAEAQPVSIDEKGYSYELYQRSKGVYLSATEVSVTEKGSNAFFSAAAHIKDSIRDRFYKTLDENTASKATGIILGDKSGIRTVDKNVYSAAGISHLFAVSGLHLAIIMGFVDFIMKCFFAPPRFRGIVMSLTAIAVMFVTGFSASVTRAGIMALVLCMSYFANRQSDTITSLFAAGMVICSLRPFAVLDCSFMLSFSAVVALVVCVPSVSKFFLACFKRIHMKGKLIRRLSDVLGISCGIAFFTSPIIVVCFGRNTLGAPLGNLLIFWYCGLTVISAVLLSAIPVRLFAVVVTACIKYIDMTSVAVASLAKYRMPEEMTFSLCFAALVIYFVYRMMGRKHENYCILAMAVLVTAAVSVGVLTSDSPKYIFTSVYQGRGSSTVLICDNKAVVIDCESYSPSAAVTSLIDYLSEKGIYKITDFVVTNGDTDEETVALLRKNIDIGNIYSYKSTQDSDIQQIQGNETIRIKELELRLISSYYSSPLCVYITAGNSVAFIPAKDCDTTDKAATTQMEKSPDILLAAERAKWSDYLLGAIKPGFAVFNSDRNRELAETTYTSRLLKYFKNNFLVTGNCGTIETSTDGNGTYKIHTQGENNGISGYDRRIKKAYQD